MGGRPVVVGCNEDSLRRGVNLSTVFKICQNHSLDKMFHNLNNVVQIFRNSRSFVQLLNLGIFRSVRYGHC